MEEIKEDKAMIIKSKSFENNGMIPKKHTGFGEDKSPELTISDIPDSTVSLAIIMDDLDVPFRDYFTHWLIWNIPGTEIIEEGLPGGEKIESPFSAIQGVAWGKHIYRGPKQPFFIRKEHRYVFYVYALDCMLNLTGMAGKKELVDAMKGHVLSEAKLMGRYKPD